jgi:hypothetical protein
MRRDAKLIFTILEHIEQNESLPNLDDEATKYHLTLAIQERYIDGVSVSKPLGDHPDIIHQIRRPQLTPEGHKYLEDMRSNTSCKRILSWVFGHIVETIMAVIVIVLGGFAMWWFGFKQ